MKVKVHVQNVKKLSSFFYIVRQVRKAFEEEKVHCVSRIFLWMNFNMNYLRMNTPLNGIFLCHDDSLILWLF